MKEYPEPLMQEHRKFIYNKSNKEMIIASIINEISKSLFNACFNDSSFTAIRTNLDILKNQMRIKLFRMLYGYMKNYIEKNGVVDTPRFEILKTYLLYLNYILASNSTENIKTEAQINNLITLGTTDSDNELKRRFDEIKIKNDNTIKELLKISDNTIEIHNYNSIKKEKVFLRLTTKLLENIYFTVYSESKNNLTCLLYDENNCPVSPVGEPDEFPLNYSDRYPCQTEADLKPDGVDKNICVNNNSNHYLTENCETMNGYGKKMCENTKIYTGDEAESCVYEDLTQKCVSPEKTTIYLNDTMDKEQFTDCHEIYNNDLDKMRDSCNSFDKCSFKSALDLSENEVGVCYAKEAGNRPNNFCIGLTGLRNNDAAKGNFTPNTGDENFNCKQVTNGGLVYNNALEENNFKCSMFDNSNFTKNNLNATEEKADEEKTNINSNENMKRMCNSLVDENNIRKCEFVEFQKNIPSSYGSKYDKITMCIPRNVTNLPNDINPNLTKSKCEGEGGIWSDVNNICVDPFNKCQSLKHEDTCNSFDNCLWTSGKSGTYENDENFEYGTCRDISISLNKIEDLIDNIHEKQIVNLINFDLIEEKVDNMVPEIKNAFAKM